MKKHILVLIILFFKIVLCYSQTNVDHKGDENKINLNTKNLYLTSIKAGQDSGCGIRYIDIVPDDTLTAIPFVNLSTSRSFDLDGNDTNDFILYYEISDPLMLGGGYTHFYITPLGGNAVCVSGSTNIADSLRYNDIIDSNKTWSYLKAYLYYNSWLMGHPSTTYGFWKNSHSYHIGVRINSGGKYLYGWIDVKYSHIIKQYAVTVPYSVTDITMTNINNKIINSGDNVDIPLTSNLPASYSWIATDNSNTIGESTFLQTTNIINDTITNTSDTIQFVTYTVTPSEDGCGGLAIPQTITIKVYPSVSIFENNLNDKIDIFPNPAQKQFTLNLLAIGITKITVYDIYGKEMCNRNVQCSHNETINISGWVKGMYIVKVSSDEGIKTEKLIVE